MYYVTDYLNAWLIRRTHDEYFVFGPFNDEGDASFICEMLNNSKLYFEEGDNYGKAKESHTVYKHIDE
jgi:hypothetical protein